MVELINLLIKLIKYALCIEGPFVFLVKRWKRKFSEATTLNDESIGMWETSESKHARNVIYERDGDVALCWFSRDFSQSRLGDREGGSNACTIIAVLMAQKCYEKKIDIWPHQEGTINLPLVKAFADSIVEGNYIHEKLHKSGTLVNVNLTVPEAIAACGTKMKFLAEWKSLVYMINLSISLHNELSLNVKEWYNNPPPSCGSDLNVVLITENRTVLIVFQNRQNTVSLIDSHQHSPHGAVVAQVTMKNLEKLCRWYCDMLFRFYGLNPDCYELSFLYFRYLKAGEVHKHQQTSHSASYRYQ